MQRVGLRDWKYCALEAVDNAEDALHRPAHIGRLLNHLQREASRRLNGRAPVLEEPKEMLGAWVQFFDVGIGVRLSLGSHS
jgi:hypothetical protein